MKKLLIAIALACCMLVHDPASAQVAPIQATLNTVSTGACSPTSCLAYTIPSGVGSAGISIVGSSGTVVFEVFDMNGNYAPVNVTPSNSGTDVSTATVTGTQFFQATHIAGQYGFRVRLTASGSAAVTINPSTSSARAGGGGGAGAGVTSVSGDGTIITNSGSTGAVTLTADTQTGTGSIVLANTPSLTTPVLGAATGTSLNLGASGVLSTTAQSGTGSLCMTTNCAMTTPNLGTPSAVTLTNATGYAFPLTVTSGVSGAVPCATSTTNLAMGTLLATNALVVGGGAGVCPGTGNGDFTYATHTLTAAAAGLVDFSPETGSSAFKIPVKASCVASATGALCKDTSTGNLIDSGNFVYEINGVPGTNCLMKNGSATGARLACSALVDAGATVASSEPLSYGTASTSSQTASNPTINTDTQLIQLSPSAGYFNVLANTYTITAAGNYTSTAASSPALTYKIQLCTVSGCGSGTVVTLLNIVTTALSATALTNATWTISMVCVTNTTGSTGNLVCKGTPGLTLDTGASIVTPDSTFADTNTATSSNIDLTAALFLRTTVAQSVAGASNSYVQTLMSLR